MKTGAYINYSTEAIQQMINQLSKFVSEPPDIIKRRNSNEIMSWAFELNMCSVILQAYAKKFKYLANPEWLPPHWAEGNSNEFIKLHQKIGNLVLDQNAEYKEFKYSFGCLYQALHMLNIFGGRDTEDRYDIYGLDKILTSDDTILDIGANCGFMVIYSIFRKGCKGECIEWNPYMVEVGKTVADYLKVKDNIHFYPMKFQDFKPDKKYTVIFSLATHWTHDGGLRPGFRDYMVQMADMLEPQGTLVFETMRVEYKQPDFYKKLEEIKDLFSWEDSKIIDSWKRELFIMKKI